MKIQGLEPGTVQLERSDVYFSDCRTGAGDMAVGFDSRTRTSFHVSAHLNTPQFPLPREEVPLNFPTLLILREYPFLVVMAILNESQQRSPNPTFSKVPQYYKAHFISCSIFNWVYLPSYLTLLNIFPPSWFSITLPTPSPTSCPALPYRQ